MPEEKREEIVKEVVAPPEAVKQQSAVPTPEAPVTPVVTEVKVKPAPVKKEKPTNCASCKKSIKGKRWYYRNGQYYCTKRCWGTTKKTANTEEVTPKA